MRDRTLLFELFLEIEEAIRRIERRFIGIDSPDDFIRDDAGLDRLDGIAMMLVAIGENIRKIDEAIGQEIFNQYPDINWHGIKGIRNIFAHDYFSIDAQEVYEICSVEITILKNAIKNIREETFGR